MGIILRDELITTPPKLTLSSFPSHKPPPEQPGALTPPLQPMISVPFQWEEAPGQPKATTSSTPRRPNDNSVRCLELPPRMVAKAKMVNMANILDGPCSGRSVSQRLCFVDPGPKVGLHGLELGLNGNGKNDLIAHFGSCRWADGKGTWDLEVGKVGLSVSPMDRLCKEVHIKVKITKFRRSKRACMSFQTRVLAYLKAFAKALSK